MPDELRILPVRLPPRSLTLRDVAAVFFRRGKVFITCFLLVLIAGLLYAVLFPSYKAEMKVLVRRGRIDPAVTPTETAPPLLDRGEISEEELNSEVELLQDEDIVRSVVLQAGLADDPSWSSRIVREDREERVASEVKTLARKLEVQPVRKSQLITVAYKSGDPRRSAAVLNALAAAYLARHVEIRRPSGQQTFFEQQMEQSHHALEQAEAQFVHFTRKKRIVSAALQRDLTLQKLSEAESADMALQTAIAEAGERVRSLEVKMRDLPERRVSQIRNADNPQLQEKLKSRLLELQLQRTDLLTKFQPSYRLVEEVEKQIAQAKAAIEAEDLKPLRDELTDANPEYEWANSERTKALVELQVLLKKQQVARVQVAAYRRTAENLGEDVLTENDLQNKLKAAQDKFLLYSNKREEARIGDALDHTGILNVTLAEEPRVPALPNWPLWMATCISFAAAFVFSSGVAFATDYADPSLRTPDELLELLQAPVLACLPARTGPPELEGL